MYSNSLFFLRSSLGICPVLDCWQTVRLTLLLILAIGILGCNGQQKRNSLAERRVGGPCEGCEALLEFGDRTLHSTDTLPGFKANTPKIKLTGTVFESDGKTPAENIILYFYHTNREGIYEKRGDETGWGRTHGYIRGWLRTGPDGSYTLYTFRPGAYPSRREPEHIHLTVKEQGTIPYYLESYHFEDDPLLTPAVRDNMRNRGGSGIVLPQSENGILTVHRDLILGMNIPDYN
ncbi:intradiol ring-cleavage dioxygenase [Robiginitalea sp. SC105]|uniref:intradiol ring-cleavage dioxygenase n=1 Tax=Robiginitalea sp. SC105 TaxID=2762332 RepID=UPI00163A2110|nr:intradiol ring-cleavage dioxygenase [Robiginitalea sp. SC105]MBC2839305.1 intradiol ring-cleavage dioxygenase [Robiginitalea sp. SC105]